MRKPRYIFYTILILTLSVLTLSCSKDLEIITLNSTSRIELFTFNGETNNFDQGLTVVGNIDYNTNSIVIKVSDQADITKLVPSIIVSNEGKISPESGTPMDFSSPVKYTVTAQDGSTETFIVTVTRVSNKKRIEVFAFTRFDNETLLDDEVIGKIDLETNEIRFLLPFEATLANLSPQVRVSKGATIDPGNQEFVDFTKPVKYTVTAEDGTTNVYTVIVEQPVISQRDALKAIYDLNSWMNWDFDQSDYDDWKGIKTVGDKIVEFDFSFTDAVIEFPSEAKNLIFLEAITYAKTAVTEIKGSFWDFPKLKKIFIKDSRISQLPPGIEKAKVLEEIIYDLAVLEKFPEGIGQAQSLKRLILNYSTFETLPVELASLKNLETIEVGSVTMIPQEVCDMQNSGTVISVRDGDNPCN